MSSLVKVKIFNSYYTLASEGDEGYLASLASYVDTKMNEIAYQIGDQQLGKIAILAALNIADEVCKMREELNRTTTQVNERSRNLIHMIEQALP